MPARSEQHPGGGVAGPLVLFVCLAEGGASMSWLQDPMAAARIARDPAAFAQALAEPDTRRFLRWILRGIARPSGDAQTDWEAWAAEELWLALQRYRPEAGTQPSTYLAPVIRTRLQRWAQRLHRPGGLRDVPASRVPTVEPLDAADGPGWAERIGDAATDPLTRASRLPGGLWTTSRHQAASAKEVLPDARHPGLLGPRAPRWRQPAAGRSRHPGTGLPGGLRLGIRPGGGGWRDPVPARHP
ncbi:protein of unknown function [Candidatus Hydrogenisulfobacillus filiaventi]|uniref:Uncharacterized protein n=1 Tax=Candidatus Hydrogenisulfobacillus filiaventi TaxID=2707344 RepID=A0A6F8ZID8_9FIRM|nr:protein of unknown function [Candidatus Hydrogenisulfobacillus filiaventi]